MKTNTTTRFLTILAILLGGGAISYILIKTRPRPTQEEKVATLLHVQTLTSKAATNPIIITAMGIVGPSHKVQLKSRVRGDVLTSHPQFLPGSTIAKGETFIHIDDIDYQLNLHQAEAIVIAAKQRLLQERGRQEIAKREWKLLKLDRDASELEKQLALRKPQLEVALSSLKSAQAQVTRAKRDLNYCNVTLPFNALLLSKSIDIGSRVENNTVIAEVVQSDSFWITAKVPVSSLKWITFPSATQKGSVVTVLQRTGKTTMVRSGHVLRKLPLLETEGRMAQVLVEIQDPLALKNSSYSPLLLGSFVRLEIRGKEIEKSYKIPRSALRNGKQVWIAQADDHLEIRTITYLWGSRDYIILNKGITESDRIINSYIPFPVNGLHLSTEKQDGK